MQILIILTLLNSQYLLQEYLQKKPSELMKFFVQIFKNIYRKLSDKIHNYVKHPHDPQGSTIRPDQRVNSDTKQIKDRRVAKKRKSFRSFLKQEENQSRIRRYIDKKKRRKYNDYKSKLYRLMMKDGEQQVQDWKDSELSEIYTKEFQSQKSHCGIIFKDGDGLQISFIQNISEKSNENSQNISIDSDPELAKFVFEDDKIQNQRKPVLMRYNFDSFLQKDNKKWWQKIIQGHKNDRPKQQVKSDQFSSSYNSQNRNQKTLDYKKGTVKKKQRRDNKFSRIKKQKNHIHIIKLIDLIDCEDDPKIFQIPLSYQLI